MPNTLDLTWKCDSPTCNREVSVRHERGVGIYCPACGRQRIATAEDPMAEADAQADVRLTQRVAVDQDEE